MFIPSKVYLGFLFSSIAYPSVFLALALLLLQPLHALSIAAVSCVMASLPLLVPRLRASARRRGVEAELPFVALLIFVLSHESFPNIAEAFAKIQELGPRVFPHLSREAALLQRNLRYGEGSEYSIIENTLADHPSYQFRSFVHGYLTALLTGKDIPGFAQVEAARFIELLEERWQGFVRTTSSLSEVGFILLSVFPVGMQMVATTFLGSSSTNLLLLSHLLLAGATIGILIMIDWVQPIIFDTKWPVTGIMVVLTTWVLSSLLHYVGLVSSVEALLVSLLSSLLVVFSGHRHFRLLREGEREVGSVLHDLAEESKAGTSLPIALERTIRYSQRFPSMRESVLLFNRLLNLGRDPLEAQREISHSAWLVRVSIAILSVCFQTGGGYEELDKLSLSFRRISDARNSLSASILPFATLGIFVPVISSAAVWFLSGLAVLGKVLPSFTLRLQNSMVGLSISLTSLLSGLIVTKAYTLSIRNCLLLPPILAATLLSIFFFGIG